MHYATTNNYRHDPEALARWLDNGAIEPKDVPPDQLAELCLGELEESEYQGEERDAAEKELRDIQDEAGNLEEQLQDLRQLAAELLAAADGVLSRSKGGLKAWRGELQEAAADMRKALNEQEAAA